MTRIKASPDILTGKERPEAVAMPRPRGRWSLRERAPEPLGILAIHASAVQMNGGALLFLGPSGTGKSTMCDLLSTAAHPLADDKVYIFPHSEHGWIVVDASDRILKGPLSEKEAAAIQGPPLHATLRLYQAPRPCLTPIDTPTTCRHLANAFFELPWQRQLDIESKRRAFAEISAITRVTPGYHFYFDRSRRALELVDAMIDSGRLRQRNPTFPGGNDEGPRYRQPTSVQSEIYQAHDSQPGRTGCCLGW